MQKYNSTRQQKLVNSQNFTNHDKSALKSGVDLEILIGLIFITGFLSFLVAFPIHTIIFMVALIVCI